MLDGRESKQDLIDMLYLLERSVDGICALDAVTLHFVYANENAQSYLGHSLTELFDLTPRELQPAAAFAAFQEALKPLYANEKIYVDIETLGLRKDGTTFPVESRLQLWHDGAQTKLFVVFKDITLRKQAEKALGESERHLAAILKAIPECIKLISSDGALESMTPAGLAMLEADSLAEVQTKRLVDYVKPEYRVGFHKLHRRVFQGHSGHLEFEVVGLKGGQRWLETYAVPLRDETGNVVSLLGATHDISARKHAEREQVLLSAIVKNSDDAIISKTLDCIITSWNRGAERLYGYTQKEMVGQPLSTIIPETLRRLEQINLQRLQQGEAIHLYETKRQHKNGKSIDVALTSTQIKDNTGRVIGISQIERDMTAQKLAEKILLNAHHHLENQVTTTKEALEKSREEATEINSALNVLFKHRDAYKSEVQIALSREVESIILPLMKKLKEASENRYQTSHLLDILENNLQHLVQSFGHNASVPVAYQQLTPVEKQVAAMIRQGLSTKVIAADLKISKETVNTHRKNIRKKLGLDGKATNLHSYLMSINE
jgi:PAS domain S-box-containing protein